MRHDHDKNEIQDGVLNKGRGTFSEEIGDPRAILSEEELSAGGMKKVDAWVAEKCSMGAKRTARNREKKKQEGVQQINVMAPIERHDAIREFAKTGNLPVEKVEVIREVEVIKEVPAQLTERQWQLIHLAERFSRLKKWKWEIISFLLGPYVPPTADFFTRHGIKISGKK